MPAVRRAPATWGLATVLFFVVATHTSFHAQTASVTGRLTLVWGDAVEEPGVGDYDGDGLADIAVFRSSTGIWYVRYSATGAGLSLVWGGSGDVPILKRP